MAAQGIVPPEVDNSGSPPIVSPVKRQVSSQPPTPPSTSNSNTAAPSNSSSTIPAETPSSNPTTAPRQRTIWIEEAEEPGQRPVAGGDFSGADEFFTQEQVFDQEPTDATSTTPIGSSTPPSKENAATPGIKPRQKSKKKKRRVRTSTDWEIDARFSPREIEEIAIRQEYLEVTFTNLNQRHVH